MINYSGKLFTFGCSMTSYEWPTWADILGKEFSCHENWGRGGAGNLFIFNSIIECIERNKFTVNDTVVILWSGITRMDFYQFGVWTATHNNSILQSNTPAMNCPDGFELINYAYFAAIDKLLSSLNLNYYMFCFLDYDTDTSAGKLYKKTLEKIVKLKFKISNKRIIKPALNRISERYNQLAGSDWPPFSNIFDYDKEQYPDKINKEIKDKFYKELDDNRRLYFDNTVIDNHPTPTEHLLAIKEFFDIKKETEDWISSINNKLLNGQQFEFKKLIPERL